MCLYEILVRVICRYRPSPTGGEGAELMLKVAKEILAAQTARQVDRLLLQSTSDQEGDEA